MNVPIETICSLITSDASGAVSGIRISGENAKRITEKLLSNISLSHRKSHTALTGKIYENDQLIDKVLIVLFDKGKSYTGDETVEIFCHASPFIVQKILQLLIQHGSRLARPGEFTMRAFLNGKMDLVQAEAVVDIIEAESEAQHKIAISQFKGGLSEELNLFRKQLLHFSAMLELELDFVEEDIAFADRKELRQLLVTLINTLKKLLDSFDQGNAIKQGIPIVIVGPPNSGKSTLLNRILNEERSIVSDIEGTTRDSIEAVFFHKGFKIRVIDTAGLRKSQDTIEQKGIQLTHQKISKAHTVLYVFDVTQMDFKTARRNASFEKFRGSVWCIANKLDLLKRPPILPKNDSKNLCISAQKGIHIELLKDHIISTFSSRTNTETMLLNTRHFEGLQRVYDTLKVVSEGLHNGLGNELLASDLRFALEAIGEITGSIEMDKDILGHIFGRFCIGK